jgi:glycosyltransferase involved in cell wall biosynthesis
MPTLNESARIEPALAAAAEADEILVADGGSTDDTVKLAESAGARVIVHAGGSIGDQRNAAIAEARNEWILALDADEEATPELWREIRSVIASPRHEAYRVRMRNFYLGRERKRGRWGRDWHVRLFTRVHRFDTSRVHESLRVSASVGTLSEPVIHHPYRSLSHHLRKMDTYARWGAQDLHARGRRAGIADLTVRPWWRFVRDYFVHGSVLDGTYGLITSALTAYSAFLKYAHLWAMEHDPKRGE